jgi:hypothetical protein
MVNLVHLKLNEDRGHCVVVSDVLHQLYCPYRWFLQAVTNELIQVRLASPCRRFHKAIGKRGGLGPHRG